jgi:hypothetical protein
VARSSCDAGRRAPAARTAAEAAAGRSAGYSPTAGSGSRQAARTRRGRQGRSGRPAQARRWRRGRPRRSGPDTGSGSRASGHALRLGLQSGAETSDPGPRQVAPEAFAKARRVGVLWRGDEPVMHQTMRRDVVAEAHGHVDERPEPGAEPILPVDQLMRVGVADLPDEGGGRGEERDLLAGAEVGCCEGGEDKGNKRECPSARRIERRSGQGERRSEPPRGRWRTRSRAAARTVSQTRAATPKPPQTVAPRIRSAKGKGRHRVFRDVRHARFRLWSLSQHNPGKGSRKGRGLPSSASAY